MCVRECQWSFSIECKIASELSSTTTEERRGRTCWWYLTVVKQERSLNVAEDSNTCWLAATLYILIEVSEVCKSSATAQFTFSLCCCFTNPTELRAWLFLTFFSFSLLLSFLHEIDKSLGQVPPLSPLSFMPICDGFELSTSRGNAGWVWRAGDSLQPS